MGTCLITGRAILRVGKIIVGVTTDHIRRISKGEKRPSAPIARASASLVFW